MNSDIELMAEVARLYYEMDMTQQEISERLFTSRSRVSRLIKQAREEGIVEITIHSNHQRKKSLEEVFVSQFKLKDVCIVETKKDSSVSPFQQVTAMAAEYLNTFLRNGMVLGLSWGNSIYHTILHLRPRVNLPDLHIVQMLGSIEGDTPEIDGPDLVRQAAEVYKCRFNYLMAPMIVEDEHVRNHLRQRSSIAEVIRTAEFADVLCTGIGTISSWQSYITPDINRTLMKVHAAGRICGFYFNDKGELLDLPIHDQIIGVGTGVFKTVPNRIAVASGDEKVGAILGALRGSYINALVTDSDTALAVMKLSRK